MFMSKILLKFEVHLFVFKLYHKGGRGGGGMSIITTDLRSILRDCKGERRRGGWSATRCSSHALRSSEDIAGSDQ